MRDLAGFLDWLGARGFAPATIIDAGACWGTQELLRAFPQSYHILIDPVVERETRFQAILKRYAGEYHLTALGATQGRGRLHIPEGAPEGASLATPSVQARVVPITRLDHLLAGRDLAQPLLIKTDCQGFDHEVIEGAGAVLDLAAVVICEVSLFHPAGRRDLADFGRFVEAMAAKGWAVIDILAPRYRPLDHALGQVDLAFVRADGPFRTDHRWQAAEGMA